MVSIKTDYQYDQDDNLVRSYLIIDFNTGIVRASAKTRELADKALALLS